MCGLLAEHLLLKNAQLCVFVTALFTMNSNKSFEQLGSCRCQVAVHKLSQKMSYVTGVLCFICTLAGGLNSHTSASQQQLFWMSPALCGLCETWISSENFLASSLSTAQSWYSHSSTFWYGFRLHVNITQEHVHFGSDVVNCITVY